MSMAILKAVWGQQQGYVFVTAKSRGGAWKEQAFKYPQDETLIRQAIDDHVRQNKDVYWCPLVFKEPKRVKESALPTANILWSDLDEIHPDLGSLKPSIAWKSSDAKYQGIWLLDNSYDTEAVERTNRDLTYHVGADKSGWDVTQVLRIPGTPNHKYDPPQQGEVLWAKRTKHSLPDIIEQTAGATHRTPAKDAKSGAILADWTLTPRLRDLLNVHPAEVEVGERSDRLWEIESGLVEAGVPILTIVEVVKSSPWNKFKGRRDEDSQIYKEILKADVHVKERDKQKSAIVEEEKPLDLTNWAVPYDVFVSKKTGKPEWLVDGIWQAGTYGMIAGEPKTYKSVLATDLALSVASGKPFLNTYEVLHPGKVLFIQEENNEATVQDRVHKVANHKGLMTTTPHGIPIIMSLPVIFSNNFGIDLTDSDCRTLIENTIRAEQPVMVILDPLYMMLGAVEENSATEVRDVLRWLTYLRNTYGCAIVLCHHYNKGNDTKTRGGSKMRGTSAFHAWVESALYVKTTTEPNTIEIEREFRTFPTTPQFVVNMELGEPGEMYYRPIVKTGSYSMELEVKKEEVVSWLAGTARSFEEIRILSRMNKKDLTRVLAELVDKGLVVKDGGVGRGNRATYVLAPQEE